MNLSRQNIVHENVINLFVPYEEVTKYLNAVDFAVVWRDNNIVNKVASPVKFSEYVCTGLPVIANNGVGLIEDYINNTKFGNVIESFDEINDHLIDDLLKLQRIDICNYGHQFFSSDAILKSYMSTYSVLLSDFNE